MTSPDTLIPAAQILAGHGLKGQLRLRILLENPQLLRNTRLATNRDGLSLVILDLKPEPGKGTALAMLKDVHDRTHADDLRGLTLFLPRSQLPPLPAGEVYLYDLVGRGVARVDGQPLGSVQGLAGTPGQTHLQVVLLDSTQAPLMPHDLGANVVPLNQPRPTKTVLIPAHADFFEDLNAELLVLSDLGQQLVEL